MVSSFYFDKGDFAPSQQDALVLEVASLGRREAALLVVCDGIGGLEEGGYASSYVTMRLRNWFYEVYLRRGKRGCGRRRAGRSCVGVLYDCNRYLQRYGEEHGIRLGTTMTMALLYGRRVFGGGGVPLPVKYQLFHVGDSRAYLLGKRCERLTKDDSCGENVLRRCIGSFPWQGVQRKRGYLWPGERILLCSDGFWRRLEERELAESLGNGGGARKSFRLSEEQAEKRLRKLGETARARGEKDNQAAVTAGAGGFTYSEGKSGREIYSGGKERKRHMQQRHKRACITDENNGRVYVTDEDKQARHR